MKLKTTLALSLVVNAAFVIGYFTRSAPVPPAASATAPRTNQPLKVLAEKRMRTAIASNFVQSIDWRRVESEDYKKYIANLRAIGCPEETIKDIIVADVNKMFETRKKALQKPKEPFKFWKTGNPFSGLALDEEAVKQQQDLAREKRHLLKELLGIETEEKPNLMAAFNPLESMLDFLPTDKQTRVMEALQTFQAKAMKSMAGGGADQEGMKNRRVLQKEMDAELSKLLTPQEKEDYDLRLSETAVMMRMQLGAFEPDEEEFRKIFQLRKQFDDEHGRPNNRSEPVEREKYELAQKQLDDQIKSTLGDDRHQEYKLAQSPTYQGLVKFAEREGMPREIANKVYDLKKTAEDQIKNLRADSSLTEDQRQSARKAIQTETEKAVGETMGTKFETYRTSSGTWLKRLGTVSPARSGTD